ncbi:hypothetical protein BBK82_31270 [Lentzea guizhouensis]|uniref:Histidine kinase/HSP90-like ATPase domain-containing protein n=2 Tax=Lentzea guizhouensis TaxID=1586287 RepID=A0A1B2HZN7_9PSEU|nr:hypothetical protein BBK82_31270 [Lentzea guizhouensis]
MDVEHAHPISESCDEPGLSSLDLGNDVHALAAVRRWTRDTLAGVAEDGLDAVLLVVNELVSNAVDHGRGPWRLRLRRSATPFSVRVEVDDPSPEPPGLGRSCLDGSCLGASRGGGLIVVSRLADDWGVIHGSGGKTVWAEITCGRTSSATRPVFSAW